MTLAVQFHFLAYLSIISILIIILLIWKDPMVHSNNIFYLLFGGFVTGLIWVISSYINRAFVVGENLFLESILGLIGNLAGLSTFGFFAIFFRSINIPKIDPKPIIIYSSLISLSLGIRYMSVVYANRGDLDLFLMARDATNIFNLFAVAYTIYLISYDYKLMLTKKINKFQRKQIQAIYYSILIAQIISIFTISLVIITNDINIILYNYIPIIISFSVIAWSIHQDPRIVSLFNDQIYMFFLSNHNGVLKYGIDVYSKDKTHPLLFSGITSALVSVINDLYDFSLEPVSTKFDNGFIHFSMEKHYFLVVFSEKESKVVKHAMTNFSKKLQDLYDDHLESVIESEEELDLEILFNHCFFFLQPKAIEHPEQVSQLLDRLKTKKNN
jgi:hypothetical protein